MPKDTKGFNWETLKTDPSLWKRLVTPNSDDKTLTSVFKGEENPLKGDDESAVEKLKKLADAGQLYVREYGRASHFRKVKMDGDEPKLGSMYVQKLNGNTDPMAGLFMRMSRAYFKWIGLESLSNWFDKKLKQRDERIERDKRTKEEYKTLSKDEKAALKKQIKKEQREAKAQKKQEKLEAKAQKKLEKLQKEVEKARKELEKLQGKDTTKTKGEMDSPLSDPPKTEEKENTMQPTQLGDRPVQNQLENNKQTLTQQPTVHQEVLGQKKEETKPEKKEEPKTVTNEPVMQININGVQYTKNDMGAIPEEIRRALELITTFIAQQKALENALQQKTPDKQTQPLAVENTAQEEFLASEKKGTPQFTIENAGQQEILTSNKPGVPNLVVESIGREEEGKTAVEGEVNKGNIPSPVEQPENLEPEKVSMQKPPEKREPTSLQQRLAEEAKEMDRVKDWKELLADSLFAHEEAKSYKGNYDMVKDVGNLGAEYLLGAIAGMLSSQADPRAKQQVMDALIGGKPLGAEHQELLKAGIASMNHAEKEATFGNKKAQAEMLADSIRELSQQASRESGLSPRNVMIGRMIGNMAAMATENGLELPLDENDMILARGAATLGDLALRHHNARQYLGQEDANLSSRAGRNAVRDLLAGKAIETMISDNQKEGQEITNTQVLMGQGLWDMENLLVMTRDSKTCQQIKPEQVKSLLEKPNGFKAATVANGITTDLLNEAMEIQKGVDEMMEKQLQNEEQLEQPEMNHMQGPG